MIITRNDPYKSAFTSNVLQPNDCAFISGVNTISKMMPATPNIRVITSWLRLPKNMRVAALTLLPSFRYNTLPRNSPNRLGVSMVKLTPAITLFTEVHRLVGWTWEVKICHFFDSSPQFTNINATVAIRYSLSPPCNTSLMCCQWLDSFGSFESWR